MQQSDSVHLTSDLRCLHALPQAPALPRHRPLTPTMLRELRCIASTGEVGDLLDYGYNALAFYAREKTLTALLARGLIVDQPGGFVLTDAGRATISTCSDCPPVGYPTDKTRCAECPRALPEQS